jgi:threonine/homoserine/homoserine lactone efflux protein
MLQAALAGAIAGYAIAIPVGAIAVLILNRAMTHGLREGLAAGGGAASADGIYAAIALLVGGVATPLISTLAQPLRLVAAVVLIGLALRGWLALRSTHDPPGRDGFFAAGRNRRGTYLTFLGLTLLNPMTVIYFAALAVGLPNLAGLAERVAFALAAFGASLSWQWLLAAFGAAVGRVAGHRLRLASAVVGNGIVFGFGLLIGLGALGT